MKLKVALLVLFSFLVSPVSEPEGWEMFEKVVFTPKYFEQADAYFDVPTFDSGLLNLEHTKVTLSGYFIPLEIDTIFILSAMPFSSCFFCGGAGPETVAEIRMEDIPSNLRPDDLVKVEGELKLNSTDISYMNFIIRNARIIE